MRQNNYKILWHRNATKAFNKITDPILKEHIVDALENIIAFNPLIGKFLAGDLKGTRSYRLGVIRILYRFYKSNLIVVVLEIGHRKEIYKKI